MLTHTHVHCVWRRACPAARSPARNHQAASNSPTRLQISQERKGVLNGLKCMVYPRHQTKAWHDLGSANCVCATDSLSSVFFFGPESLSVMTGSLGEVSGPPFVLLLPVSGSHNELTSSMKGVPQAVLTNLLLQASLAPNIIPTLPLPSKPVQLLCG